MLTKLSSEPSWLGRTAEANCSRQHCRITCQSPASRLQGFRGFRFGSNSLPKLLKRLTRPRHAQARGTARQQGHEAYLDQKFSRWSIKSLSFPVDCCLLDLSNSLINYKAAKTQNPAFPPSNSIFTLSITSFITMVVVAVAGGTGGVGKTIVEAFAADGKHEVKILSRKVRRHRRIS